MNNASKIYLDQVAIGKRIRKIRKLKGVSVDDICHKMDNISPQAVYKWQRGSCLPDVENLLNLSILLETTIERTSCSVKEKPTTRCPLFLYIRMSHGKNTIRIRNFQ